MWESFYKKISLRLKFILKANIDLSKGLVYLLNDFIRINTISKSLVKTEDADEDEDTHDKLYKLIQEDICLILSLTDAKKDKKRLSHTSELLNRIKFDMSKCKALNE